MDKYNPEDRFKDKDFLKALKYIKDKTAEYVASGSTLGAGYIVVSGNNVLGNGVFGLNDIYNNELITNKTKILLASVSKPISGTLICYLQKLYNSNIINTNGEIPSSVKYLTENIAVKDLIAHISGIPEQYGTLQEAMGYSRPEIIKALKFVDNKNFRDEIQYTNIPFTHGVEVALTSLGYDFETAYNSLFTEIGMTNSSINYENNKYKGYVGGSLLNNPDNVENNPDNVENNPDNVDNPDIIYNFGNNPNNINTSNNVNSVDNNKTNIKWLESANYNVREQVSAGGIYSTITDMGKFIQFHLKYPEKISADFQNPIFCQNGKYKGIGTDIIYKKIGTNLYKTFSHSGALDNTRTRVFWVNDLDFGIFVWTNSSPNGFPEAVIEAFLSILNKSDPDPVYNNVYKLVHQYITDELFPLALIDNGTKIHTGKYDGKYYNNVYGNLIIENNIVTFGKIKNNHLKTNGTSTYFVWTSKYDLPYTAYVKLLDSNIIVSVWNTTISYNRV